MRQYKRYYQPLSTYLKPNHVLVIYGPRRVGKTTLIRDFLFQTPLKYRLDSGDNSRMHALFMSQDFKQLKEYAEGYQLIVIDEAQQIPNIGMGLKILVDEVPGLHIIATGSSSFELLAQIGEPLTGRKTTLHLFPFSQQELSQAKNKYDLKEELEHTLLFGAYPDVVLMTKRADKIQYLLELKESYILRDILTLEKVKGSSVLLNLLQLLSFQVGQLVSHHELSLKLGLDVKTVERYIDLLEKSFIIFHLSGLSRNLRNEIGKKRKYYFYDNGIRNAIISQFNSLELRQDVGALWENFMVSERVKYRSYTGRYATPYFWRSYSGQEIDYIEEYDGLFHPYEMKFSDKKTVKLPTIWADNYKHADLTVIHKSNFLDWIID